MHMMAPILSFQCSKLITYSAHPYVLFQRGKECRKLQTREPQFQTLLYFTNAVLKMMTHINRNIYLHMAFKDISVMRLIVL